MNNFLQKHLKKISNHNKRNGILVLVAIIVLIVGGTFLAKDKYEERSAVNCDEVASSINNLISQKNYEAADTEAKKYTKRCELSNQKSKIDSHQKTDAKALEILKNSDSAIDAYMSGDRTKANAEAANTISQVEKIAPEDQANLSNERTLELVDAVQYMSLIQEGRYHPNLRKTN